MVTKIHLIFVFHGAIENWPLGLAGTPAFILQGTEVGHDNI